MPLILIKMGLKVLLLFTMALIVVPSLAAPLRSTLTVVWSFNTPDVVNPVVLTIPRLSVVVMGALLRY
jgi:hypothetical protein